MSMRSIIEINHDYVTDLKKNGHISQEFHDWLTDSHWRERYSHLDINGLRYLRMRHHSDTVKLTVE